MLLDRIMSDVNDDNVLLLYVARPQNSETSTESAMMTVNEQTSSADSHLSSVTDKVSTVTDSQTQTGIHCTVMYCSRSCSSTI